MAQQTLFINSRDELYRLDISQIVLFEADGNYTSFLLRNKLRGVVGMNLSQMQQLLSSTLHEDAATFARVGKRFIVNLSYVYHIVPLRQELTLTDGQLFVHKIAVSRDALKKLKEIYVSVIGRETAAASRAAEAQEK